MIDIAWPAVALVLGLLVFFRSKQWVPVDTAKLMETRAIAEAVREAYKSDLNILTRRMNEMAEMLSSLGTVAPHYEELLRQFEELKSRVDSLRATASMKKIAGI